MSAGENIDSGGPRIPDFDSIRQLNEFGAEYWSARDLAPLLGYTTWQRFQNAIDRAVISSQQVGQVTENHFSGAAKMVILGSGAKRQLKDFLLSRFACYLIAQNGDPRKPEIASAQAYFAIATRENEVTRQLSEEERRLELRERLSENDKGLAQAAHRAGVLPRNFGQFQDAGYEGLYGGLKREDLKQKRGLPNRADVLDYMDSTELAANDFRITQTRDKLIRDGIIGAAKATETHREIGSKIRETITELGGTMPEELPTPKESIKQLKRGKAKNSKVKAKLPRVSEDSSL